MLEVLVINYKPIGKILLITLVFLTIHIVAYSLFPRLKSSIPDPPELLNSLVDFNL